MMKNKLWLLDWVQGKWHNAFDSNPCAALRELLSNEKPDYKATIEGLLKALEAAPGGLIKGEALQVEPLPDCFFAGSVVSVVETATGDQHEVFSSYYDKDLKGTVVTIQALPGKYRDLDPGTYDVWEVLVYSDAGGLTRKNVYSK